jgi:hypothetical protein
MVAPKARQAKRTRRSGDPRRLTDCCYCCAGAGGGADAEHEGAEHEDPEHRQGSPSAEPVDKDGLHTTESVGEFIS